MRRESGAALWRLLHEGGPLSCVYYADLVGREDTAELLEALSQGSHNVRRTTQIEDAFDEAETTTALLLLPDNERDAVLELDGRREALSERQTPVVLFLLRDGQGARALAEAPGLAGWLRGRDVDPDHLDAVDLKAERAAFERDTGRTAEAWLSAWRTGQLTDTLDNNLTLQRALLLEENA